MNEVKPDDAIQAWENLLSEAVARKQGRVPVLLIANPTRQSSWVRERFCAPQPPDNKLWAEYECDADEHEVRTLLVRSTKRLLIWFTVALCVTLAVLVRACTS